MSFCADTGSLLLQRGSQRSWDHQRPASHPSQPRRSLIQLRWTYGPVYAYSGLGLVWQAISSMLLIYPSAIPSGLHRACDLPWHHWGGTENCLPPIWRHSKNYSSSSFQRVSTFWVLSGGSILYHLFVLQYSESFITFRTPNIASTARKEVGPHVHIHTHTHP